MSESIVRNVSRNSKYIFGNYLLNKIQESILIFVYKNLFECFQYLK